jgi:CDP-diacylglycerol---serine O-phosphatidyltransferase
MSEPTSPKESSDQAAETQSSESGVSSSLDILVDEHEEEVSEDGKTVRHRGVYLLPNLFTTAALFCGFYAVISAMRGGFEAAAIAIFFAAVLDGMDGRIARLTNTQSKFGAEYDSLADMVSFGVAPALVMFSWALGNLGKFGWSAAFIFVACAALRLARFNTQAETADKNYFTGLASPAAACIVASTVWVCYDLGWIGEQLPYEVSILVAFLTAAVGLLMVANVPYYSFKGIDFRGRVPFAVMLALVLVIGLATLDPPWFFLLVCLSYAASGPIMMLMGKRV